MKEVRLSVSKIASLIGLDYYNNFVLICCEIWKKYDIEDYNMISEKIKLDGKKAIYLNDYDDMVEFDKMNGTNVMNQIDIVNNLMNKTSIDLKHNQVKIEKYIKKQDIEEDEKNKIIKKMCSLTNKTHGINNENNIIKEFCKLSGKEIINTQGWIEIELNNTEQCKWLIIGKYDGITKDNELIEAKMRQKYLFKNIRDYENIQVQLYLHGLKFNKAYLIEGYTNKNKEMQLYTHEINYNLDYINEFIIYRLNKFILFFNELMINDNMKMELLLGDNNHQITNYYNSNFLDIIDF